MEFDKKDESQFLILNDAVKNLDWYLENASSEPVDDPDFQNVNFNFSFSILNVLIKSSVLEKVRLLECMQKIFLLEN